MSLNRTLAALLSLTQGELHPQYLKGQSGVCEMYPQFSEDVRKNKKQVLFRKALEIVNHDRILNGRRNLKIGVDETCNLV